LFLKDNPDIFAEVENKVREFYNIGNKEVKKKTAE